MAFAHRPITAMMLVLGFHLLAPAAARAATITVDTTEQGVHENDGQCSLQEAIYSANFDAAIAIASTNPDQFVSIPECAPGSGDDTIALPAGEVFEMSAIVDDAHNPFGPTATPIVFSTITIEANGARLEHAANGVNFRAFAVGTASVSAPAGTVSGTGNLTLRNIHVKGFTVKGGDGADGGGGGMGAGGAIYVDGSGGHGGDNFTVENSTFEGNGAAGGNGSGGAFTAGGGGGGLSGNGGHIGPSGLAGGGGGGGARGNGGDGGSQLLDLSAGGGGGGGTVTGGESAYPPGTGSSGGYRCGGEGGAAGDACIEHGFGGDNGDDGSCPGGGGGGGASFRPLVCVVSSGSGGRGHYGGGGGGSGTQIADGGAGGFGGGGGAGDVTQSSIAGFGPSGGNGGFGGGGGAGHGGYLTGGPGHGGQFAGDASTNYGGGGAGLGGAIFSHLGNITIRNSTFTGNFAVRGLEGGSGAGRGGDAGGAIFAADGSLTVLDCTVSGNEGTGEGAGIVVTRTVDSLVTSFTLRNTIIASNGVRECFYGGGVTAVGSGNLIQNNFGCPGMVSSSDPLLGPLQINAPGNTPTMAIGAASPAVDAADPATSLATDQRGVARPVGDGFDIGAYEYGNVPPVAQCKDVTVQAGPGCTADASVDDGSYDPEGGPVTLTQSPAGPYALGPTQVTLTVTDGDGASSTCTATVTVLDDAAPVVTIALARPVLSPLRAHDLVNVGLGATATDACGATGSLDVRVFGDEDDETPTSASGTVFSPDARDVALSTLRLRAERVDSRDGRVYLIVVGASDGSGNAGHGCATVVVPHSSSSNSMASVGAQAAAAQAFCETHGAAPPAGYVAIGDGPVIGPKQ